MLCRRRGATRHVVAPCGTVDGPRRAARPQTAPQLDWETCGEGRSQRPRWRFGSAGDLLRGCACLCERARVQRRSAGRRRTSRPRLGLVEARGAAARGHRGDGTREPHDDRRVADGSQSKGDPDAASLHDLHSRRARRDRPRVGGPHNRVPGALTAPLHLLPLVTREKEFASWRARWRACLEGIYAGKLALPPGLADDLLATWRQKLAAEDGFRVCRDWAASSSGPRFCRPRCRRSGADAGCLDSARLAAGRGVPSWARCRTEWKSSARTTATGPRTRSSSRTARPTGHVLGTMRQQRLTSSDER